MRINYYRAVYGCFKIKYFKSYVVLAVTNVYHPKAMCNMALHAFRLDGYTVVHKALKDKA